MFSIVLFENIYCPEICFFPWLNKKRRKQKRLCEYKCEKYKDKIVIYNKQKEEIGIIFLKH